MECIALNDIILLVKASLTLLIIFIENIALMNKKIWLLFGIIIYLFTLNIHANAWADYVFEKDYPLLPLEDLEKFI